MSFWYDNTESLLRTSFRVSGTVLPRMLYKPEFYGLSAVHFTLVAFRHMGHMQEVIMTETWTLPWGHLGIMTALMTFFMVFYLNYSLSRYKDLYNASRDILLIVFELVGDARLRLQRKKQHLNLASRLIIASVTMFFFEVSGKVIGDHELHDVVVRQGLLTHREAGILMRFTGDKVFLSQSWALEAIAEGLGPKGERFVAQFTEKMSRLRQQQYLISDQLALRMPFQYFHMMNFMMTLNLCLWAYGMGVWPSNLASVIFMLALVMFLGVRELAGALSDPYGEDSVDFPTRIWAAELMHHTTELIHCDWEMTLAAALHKAEAEGELSALDMEDIGEIQVPLPATRFSYRQAKDEARGFSVAY